MANLLTALKAFWSILTCDEKAAAWTSLDKAIPLPPQADSTPAEARENSVPTQPAAAEALHMLAILQRDARLVDFLQEDLTAYDDATVGAVSRKVHDDCRRCLDKHFHLVPVLEGQEQSQVTIEASYDPCAIRLTGKPNAQPPFAGCLQHRGWKAEKMDFPVRNSNQAPAIVCPAEIEISH